MPDNVFWYLSRTAGLTAYVLLTLNVCLGLMVRTRALDWLLARWRAFDLHQFTALLALAFVLLHVLSLLGDQFVGFSVTQLFVPFASSYRPVSVAIGILAFYVMGGIIASFYLRRLIGHSAWRAIHYLTFAVFVLALAHGIFAGSDTGQAWAAPLYCGSGGLIAALTVWRFARTRNARREAPSQRRLDAVRPAA
jgi:sulfoxide reductase heme-binding subunit YedZ